MKKNPFMLISLLVLLFINSGCNDSDDDVINPPTTSVQNVTANINGISDSVDSVFLAIDSPAKKIIAKTKFENNQFTFTLPQIFDQDYLHSVSSDELFKNLNISNNSAKICYGEFYAYKNDQAVGFFAYTDGATFGTKSTYYIYTDKDVTITGKVNNGSQTFITANCALKTGWNLITTYSKSSENEHIETWETVTYNDVKWTFVKFE